MKKDILIKNAAKGEYKRFARVVGAFLKHHGKGMVTSKPGLIGAGAGALLGGGMGYVRYKGKLDRPAGDFNSSTDIKGKKRSLAQMLLRGAVPAAISGSSLGVSLRVVATDKGYNKLMKVLTKAYNKK